MTRRERRIHGLMLLGAAIVVTSLFAGCTDVQGEGEVTPAVGQGQDATSPVGQVPEKDVTPSVGQMPEKDITPSAGAEPEKDIADPAEPVPAPSGGDVLQTVVPVEVPEPIETGLIAKASPGEGLTVELSSVEPIESSAPAPGQVSGPALAITILIKNSSADPVDTSGIEISLKDSSGNPGAGMIGEPAEWFKGPVDPGAEATGVYVFTVEESARDMIRVSFSLRPGLPAVVFAGSP